MNGMTHSAGVCGGRSTGHVGRCWPSLHRQPPTGMLSRGTLAPAPPTIEGCSRWLVILYAAAVPVRQCLLRGSFCAHSDPHTAVHHNRIVHRDIKPENILLSSGGTAKLADLGVSHIFDDGQPTTLRGSDGTPYYLAPEMLSGAPFEAFPTDVWALGVTMYACIFGSLPFWGDNPLQLNKAICEDECVCSLVCRVALGTATCVPHVWLCVWCGVSCRLVVPDEVDGYPVPTAVAELLSGMLTKNPEERMSLHQLRVRQREPHVIRCVPLRCSPFTIAGWGAAPSVGVGGYAIATGHPTC